MKGIVFTEFLEMVEQKFGIETLDQIIQNSDLPSQGIYTSVGTYDFYEMLSLIGSLSQVVNIPVPDLVHAYGLYFFQYLEKSYPKIFESYPNAHEFLASVESHIHVQVRKIYPDAELPHFDIVNKEKGYMEMIYTSDRALYQFALALMQKAFDHYQQEVKIEFKLLDDLGKQVQFNLTYA